MIPKIVLSERYIKAIMPVIMVVLIFLGFQNADAKIPVGFPSEIDPLIFEDDTRWSSIGDFNGIVRSIVTYGNTIYVAGSFSLIGEKNISKVAMWNGIDWHSVGNLTAYSVLDLAVDNDGNLYASGILAETSYNFYVARWDGNTWEYISTDFDGEISALAIDSNFVYVGGYFKKVGDLTVNGIARWDGESWTAMGDGVSGSYVATILSLAVGPNGDIYAGGVFDSPSGGIIRWNGSSWSSVGSGLATPVQSLWGDWDGHVVAGGQFNTVGSTSYWGIAKWDGVNWSTIGSGCPWTKAITVDHDGRLYAGGDFSGSVAVWDISEWKILGSGISHELYPSTVYALGNTENYLYVGGQFTSAGGQPTRNFARWTIKEPQPVEPVTGLVWDGPSVGVINATYTFTVSSNPITATLPITYNWQVTDQTSRIVENGLSSTNSYNWTSPGTKIITVTASNQVGNSIPITRTIEIKSGVETIIYPDEDTTVDFIHSEGNSLSIFIPQGAVTEATDLRLTLSSIQQTPPNLSYASIAFNLDAFQGGSVVDHFVFATPIKVTVNYSDQNLPLINESSLLIMYWKDGEWVDSATSCVPTSTYDRKLEINQVSTEICHLTTFGVFGKLSHNLFLPLLTR